MHSDTGHLRYRDLAPRHSQHGDLGAAFHDGVRAASLSLACGSSNSFENAFYTTRLEPDTGSFEGLAFQPAIRHRPGAASAPASGPVGKIPAVGGLKSGKATADHSGYPARRRSAIIPAAKPGIEEGGLTFASLVSGTI